MPCNLTFTDARRALRHAYSIAPAVVAWLPGDRRGCWVVYKAQAGAPTPDTEPELFVGALGRPPIPLDDSGCDVLASIVYDAVQSCVV